MTTTIQITSADGTDLGTHTAPRAVDGLIAAGVVDVYGKVLRADVTVVQIVTWVNGLGESDSRRDNLGSPADVVAAARAAKASANYVRAQARGDIDENGESDHRAQAPARRR